MAAFYILYLLPREGVCKRARLVIGYCVNPSRKFFEA
jgi:hypothetical protein